MPDLIDSPSTTGKCQISSNDTVLGTYSLYLVTRGLDPTRGRPRPMDDALEGRPEPVRHHIQ